MIEHVQSTFEGVELAVDGVHRTFSWTWLRDHARDPDSYHAPSHQRLVPAAVAAVAPPADVHLDTAGAVLTVTWPGGPSCEFPEEMFGGLAPAASMYDVFSARQEPWDAHSLPQRLVRLPYGEFVGDDAARADALGAFRRDGVVLVERVPTDRHATRTVLERIAYVRSSIFGDVWRFGSDGELDDTASTSLEITPHTDGTYSRDAPGLLSLHCHRAAARGGESLLVDGLTLHSQMAAEDPPAAAILETVQIPGRYLGDGSDLVAWRPLFRLEAGRLVQVSYNNHDRAPFLLPPEQEGDFYSALAVLESLLERPGNVVEIRLEKGQMILVDNWRLLHGRRAFTGRREMAGGYLNREDLESGLRRIDVA